MKLPGLLFLLIVSGCAQTNSQDNGKHPKDLAVGGSCEGCEAVHESPVRFEDLSAVDTLPDYQEQGEKIRVFGYVFQKDGKTPAPDVVIYIYHTDQEGNYSGKGNEKGWGKRHGYIRGWIKTNEKGFFEFYTLRPASYPNSQNPQHIHVTIKEPGKTAYWIDEYHFDDDPYFTQEHRQRAQQRGGSGILQLQKENNFMQARRDIILGKNIPSYPS